MINFREKLSKLMILELSSSAVKGLIGPINKIKDISKFIRFDEDTDTILGLKGNKMDMLYFKKNVLPIILKYIKLGESLGAKIVCVGTAPFRRASNIEEIKKLIPVPLKVLTTTEEAGMALYGYLQNHKRDLRKYKYIVAIDCGGMSSEICVHNIGSISLNLGSMNISNRESELKRLDKQFGWLKEENNVLLVSVGARLCNATKKIGLMNQHDIELSDEAVDYHKGLKDIRSIIGHHTLVTNAINLSMGTYYKYIDGKL